MDQNYKYSNNIKHIQATNNLSSTSSNLYTTKSKEQLQSYLSDKHKITKIQNKQLKKPTSQ